MSQRRQATAPPPARPPRPPPRHRPLAAAPQPCRPTSDTPSRLRLLTLGVLVAGMLFGVVGALAFAYQAYSLSPRRGQRRPADPGPADPDQPAERRRHRDQRVPGRRARAAGSGPTYDEAIDADRRADRRGRRGRSRRRRGAGRRSTSRSSSYAADDRAGPGQQPAGTSGRRPVPAQRQRRAAGRRAADPRQPGRGQRRAGDGRDGRPRSATGSWSSALLVSAAWCSASVWLARRFQRTDQPRPAGRRRSCCVALVGRRDRPAADRQRRSTTSRTARFAAVNAAAQARIAANDAKSNESLTLIARGSGAAFEEAWVGLGRRRSLMQPGPPSAGPTLTDQWAGLRRGAHRDPRARRRRRLGRGRRPGHRHRRRTRPTPRSAPSTTRLADDLDEVERRPPAGAVGAGSRGWSSAPILAPRWPGWPPRCSAAGASATRLKEYR